nr:cyclic 2,3-diphosphoglycerate synthase [uncultured Anaeromusa sp.]
MHKVVILGAAGRDFHVFNTCFKDDADSRVVAFTATQIPDIAGRRYPPSLAGHFYPQGIPIVPEEELEILLRTEAVDEVVFAYSDVSHETVMHVASRVLASGADFRLLGPAKTMLQASKPVIAVCAVRTGAGKSQVSRKLASWLKEWGLRVAIVRHPMPYGELERQRCQRFATVEDLQRARCTVEEREEYEPHLAAGHIVYAGVDYGEVLAAAEAEADVLLWDGGNNDFSFFQSDWLLVVADPLRLGHERSYHPGETNLRMADVVIINKVDSVSVQVVALLQASIAEVNSKASVVLTASPPRLDRSEELRDKRVVVVEDGPSVTHGGMAYGAGLLAARAAGAEVVDPWPWTEGSLARAQELYPHLRQVLPALGYQPEQLEELETALNAASCEAIVSATPSRLERLLRLNKPLYQVGYELEERPPGILKDLLQKKVQKWSETGRIRDVFTSRI